MPEELEPQPEPQAYLPHRAAQDWQRPGATRTLLGEGWAAEGDWGGFNEDIVRVPMPLPPTYAGAALARMPTEEEVAGHDWNILPNKKTSKKIKEVVIDKTTYSIIKEITDEIINENLNILRNIYKNRVDFIENNDYTGFLGTVPPLNEYGDRISPEATSYTLFENAISGFKSVTNGDAICSYQGAAQYKYLLQVEEKAKQRYSIEHSKYKYYPRLKGTVKYGNPELLDKLLCVTQIGKGKVICR